MSDLKKLLLELNPDAITYQEFDEAECGIVEGGNDAPVMLYDQSKCLEIMKFNGASEAMTEGRMRKYKQAVCIHGPMFKIE